MKMNHSFFSPTAISEDKIMGTRLGFSTISIFRKICSTIKEGSADPVDRP